jgi:hypothetical protein
MVLFLEETDIAKIKVVGKQEGWNMYASGEVAEIVTKTEGLLILRPIECRGLNTPFAITAKVLIGCELEDESEHVQMTGRSCRTRGINHSEYYFDKWPNEAAVRIAWKSNVFSKANQKIKFFKHLKDSVSANKESMVKIGFQGREDKLVANEVTHALKKYYD